MSRWAPAAERFATSYVVTPEGCWLWIMSRDTSGYGAFYDGRTLRAHRWAYETHVGPVPDGLELDHLCRNRACVNPDHLEPVTHSENCQRSPLRPNCAAHERAKTHCPQGHPLSGDNLYLYTNTRGVRFRKCRECRRAQWRAWKARQAA